MATYDATITLAFDRRLDNSCRYNGDIVWRQNGSIPKSDRLIIGGRTIQLISYRSRKMHAESALNNLALRSLRTAFLYVAAVLGRVPSPKSVTVTDREGGIVEYGRESADLAIPLFEWEYSCLNSYEKSLLVPADVAQVLFQQTRTAKRVRVSFSFLLAAMQAIREEDRLRYLWSAFNPLYQHFYYLCCDKTSKEDNTCLRVLSKHIKDNKLVLKRAESYLSSIDYASLADKMHWYLVSQNKDEEKDTTNTQTKKPKPRMSKHMFIHTIPERQRLSFLVTWYPYYFRCSSVHGNKSFSIFPLNDSNKHMYVINNLLTLAIIDVIEACSAMEHVKGVPDESS